MAKRLSRVDENSKKNLNALRIYKTRGSRGGGGGKGDEANCGLPIPSATSLYSVKSNSNARRISLTTNIENFFLSRFPAELLKPPSELAKFMSFFYCPTLGAARGRNSGAQKTSSHFFPPHTQQFLRDEESS